MGEEEVRESARAKKAQSASLLACLFVCLCCVDLALAFALSLLSPSCCRRRPGVSDSVEDDNDIWVVEEPDTLGSSATHQPRTLSCAACRRCMVFMKTSAVLLNCLTCVDTS